MSSEEIKEKISIAKKAVENESEPYKTEAFKIILSSLISGAPIKSTSKSKTKTKSVREKKPDKSTPVTFEQKNDISELAEKCGVSSDTLSEVVTIKNNVIQLIKRPSIKESEKHILFTLCILTCYKILYELEWIQSHTLKKCLDESGVGDLTHSAQYIKKSSLILDRGSGKGMEYKITGKGMDKAFEIMKKLSKDEPIIEN